MDKIKIILTIVVVLLASLGLFVAIGFLYSLVFYVFVLGVIGVGGYVAFKLFTGGAKEQSQLQQLDSKLKELDPKKELQKVQRLLDEYKRK